MGQWMLGALAAVLMPTFDTTAEPADREIVARRVYLMGTRATLTTLAVDRERGLSQLELMLGELEAIEAELSTWREDSPLSRINRQPVGIPHPAPPEICRLLFELARWSGVTGGAFDPAIGTLISAWGLRGRGRQPGEREVAAALESSGLEHLSIEPTPCRVTRRTPVVLDAGAFGKGVALDRASRLGGGPGRSPWMIDLGGQVAVGGPVDEGWSISIAHPQRRDAPALELRLTEGSLATSGGSERDRGGEGERIGHVLDPRSGHTVSRPESVTVWHERAVVADILSTALYVMGPLVGLAWAEERGFSVCYLAPQADRVRVIATPAFRSRFLAAPG